jgi:tRNA pseudouridine-54 N-methylase
LRGYATADSNTDSLHEAHPELKGFYGAEGGLTEALEVILAAEPPPAVLLLAASGQGIEEVCTALKGDARLPESGVVVILGDNRGLSTEDEAVIKAVVARRGAALHTASLGQDVLFASHTIVLLHHYLDRLLHSCQVKPPREYSTAKSRTSWNNWQR